MWSSGRASGHAALRVRIDSGCSRLQTFDFDFFAAGELFFSTFLLCESSSRALIRNSCLLFLQLLFFLSYYHTGEECGGLCVWPRYWPPFARTAQGCHAHSLDLFARCRCLCVNFATPSLRIGNAWRMCSVSPCARATGVYAMTASSSSRNQSRWNVGDRHTF